MADDFATGQARTAAWMGYPDAEAMNRDHDALHGVLCAWLGIPSHALRCAVQFDHDPVLAGVEEDAVLHLQRLIAHHGVPVPHA